MSGHICPWWGGYFIDNPLRWLLHDPAKIVGPYIMPGMTVVDIGCGMGFLSLAMARMVGERGVVIAVDLQQQMLEHHNAAGQKAGLAERIRPHRCQQDRLGVDARVDFAVAMMMVHERCRTSGCCWVRFTAAWCRAESCWSSSHGSMSPGRRLSRP